MAPINVLRIGVGEYTAGPAHTRNGGAADKPTGAVSLTCFDLRRRGLVGRIALCDRTGANCAAIRSNMQKQIGGVYTGLDVTMDCFPEDQVQGDPQAYLKAIGTMQRGDVAIISTPDDTHFAIAAACIKAGLHTLVASPLVKTLEQHRQLAALAEQHGVLAATDFPNRFNSAYTEARSRISELGPFCYYHSYMAQPNDQLDTSSGWMGSGSDASFHLNSHHVDMHAWSVGYMARPMSVTANAATGVVGGRVLGRAREDAVTLITRWEGLEDGSTGTAVYTASWIASKSDRQPQQHFHYIGQCGEVHSDQASGDYDDTAMGCDQAAYPELRAPFMRYVPGNDGNFAGQDGYGYMSITKFIQTAADLRAGVISMGDVAREGQLALVGSTLAVTAILEAGRRSLDAGGAAVDILYDAFGAPLGLRMTGASHKEPAGEEGGWQSCGAQLLHDAAMWEPGQGGGACAAWRL